MIRYLVLGFLLDGEPRHGYALMKDAHAKMRVLANSGSFYRELRMLERAGQIAVHRGGVREGARRASYVITPAGRHEFLSWLHSSPLDLRTAEDDLSARALFIGEPPRPEDRALVQKWQDRLWIECKILERERDELLESREDRASSWRLELLLTRRIARAAADLELLGALRQGLECMVAAVEDKVDGADGARPRESGAKLPATRRETLRAVPSAPGKARRSLS
ncbi:PadR family transcriptional regulator [Candidatus Binatia bacterium]|jgi:DNA-binding PadR family transcriptional regulator|nr:PadR family transcriptional regulator [Candidatus Binatia bacterium]